MNDILKKRSVGVLVLVSIGVLLPLLLARCLHGGSSDDQAMRVYEIAPDGQAQRAEPDDDRQANGDSDSQRNDADGTPDDDTGSSRQAATERAGETPPAAAPGEDVERESEDTIIVSDADQTPEMPPVLSSSGSESIIAADTPPNVEPPASPNVESRAGNDTADRAAADAGSDPDSLRRTESAGGWVVQVASFGDEANAQRLARELGSDFNAFYRAGAVNGTTYYRVRVGPFDSEAEARAADRRLRQNGRSTLVRRAE